LATTREAAFFEAEDETDAPAQPASTAATTEKRKKKEEEKAPAVSASVAATSEKGEEEEEDEKVPTEGVCQQPARGEAAPSRRSWLYLRRGGVLPASRPDRRHISLFKIHLRAEQDVRTVEEGLGRTLWELKGRFTRVQVKFFRMRPGDLSVTWRGEPGRHAILGLQPNCQLVQWIVEPLRSSLMQVLGALAVLGRPPPTSVFLGELHITAW